MEIFLWISIIISFLVTLFVLPNWIKRAEKAGFVGKDMNKYKDKKTAEGGGISVVAGFILGVLIYVALQTFYFKHPQKIIEIFSLLLVVLIVAFVGFIDDIFGWKIGLGKKIRIILVFFAAVPLMVINAGTSSIALFFFGRINIGFLYPLLIIPLGVVGASIGFNSLAGYNGLEAGQGILILFSLAIISWMTGNSWLSLIALCMVASLFAFLFFNKYPAKVFPGDIMTYSIGALIACMAILGNFEKIAIFIFTPYIMEVILKLRGRLNKESFGKPQEDGSLEMPYKKIYGLEHLAIFILKKFKKRVYEKDVVLLIYGFQAIVIILAFIIFRNNLF